MYVTLQDSQTKRTLTLISKTIQSLGNLVSSPSLQKEYKKEYKEEYMACVFDSVYTESRVLAVRQVRQYDRFLNYRMDSF